MHQQPQKKNLDIYLQTTRNDVPRLRVRNKILSTLAAVDRAVALRSPRLVVHARKSHSAFHGCRRRTQECIVLNCCMVMQNSHVSSPSTAAAKGPSPRPRVILLFVHGESASTEPCSVGQHNNVGTVGARSVPSQPTKIIAPSADTPCVFVSRTSCAPLVSPRAFGQVDVVVSYVPRGTTTRGPDIETYLADTPKQVRRAGVRSRRPRERAHVGTLGQECAADSWPRRLAFFFRRACDTAILILRGFGTIPWSWGGGRALWSQN